MLKCTYIAREGDYGLVEHASPLQRLRNVPNRLVQQCGHAQDFPPVRRLNVLVQVLVLSRDLMSTLLEMRNELSWFGPHIH